MTLYEQSAGATLLASEPPPLEFQEGGQVIRVKGTRVSLDTVIGAFDTGATAEQIVLRYPTLDLPDVYRVISWYPAHREEAESYLRRRKHLEESTRREVEERWPPADIRERLLTRSEHVA